MKLKLITVLRHTFYAYDDPFDLYIYTHTQTISVKSCQNPNFFTQYMIESKFTSTTLAQPRAPVNL